MTYKTVLTYFPGSSHTAPGYREDDQWRLCGHAIYSILGDCPDKIKIFVTTKPPKIKNGWTKARVDDLGNIIFKKKGEFYSFALLSQTLSLLKEKLYLDNEANFTIWFKIISVK